MGHFPPQERPQDQPIQSRHKEPLPPAREMKRHEIKKKGGYL